MNVCTYSSMTRPADPKNHSWKVKQENTEEEGSRERKCCLAASFTRILRIGLNYLIIQTFITL